MGFKAKQTQVEPVEGAPTSLPTTPSERTEVIWLLIHLLTPTSRKRILTPVTATRNSKPSDDTVGIVEDLF